jgi:signal transduction histidine kinase
VAAAQAPAPTAEQAKGIVKRAIAYAKQNGTEKLFQQTNQMGGIFYAGLGSEMYLFVYNPKGDMMAIGYNPATLVGKNRLDLKDPDGKAFVREFIAVAQKNGSGWVDYKYSNPVSKKVEAKTSYVELSDGLIYCCGIYKK